MYTRTFGKQEIPELIVLVKHSTLRDTGTKVWNVLGTSDCNPSQVEEGENKVNGRGFGNSKIARHASSCTMNISGWHLHYVSTVCNILLQDN